ncbi:MAG: gliding motility-associated C-terminal domain-containing protein [Bacteroidales bacterium]
MKTEKMSDKSFWESLRNFEIQPSPGVWEKISASDTAPVAKPRSIRYVLMGAAAVVLLTSLLLWYYAGDKNPVDVEGTSIVAEPSGTPREFAQQDQIDPLHASGDQANWANADNQESPKAGVRQPGNEPAQTGALAKGTIDKPQLPQLKPVKLPEPPVQAPKQTPPLQKNTGEDKKPGDQTVTESTLQKENTSGEVSADLKVTPLEVFIPSAFTPDNDGINDFFLPVIQDNTEVKEYRMQIFARNGTLLFESVNQEIGWDGRHIGTLVDDPVCIYVISFRDPDGNPYLRRGTITIIK